MPISRETRKPIVNLSIADLECFPIWEYATDEELDVGDETWIRPVDKKEIPGKAYSQIVAADFQSASGRLFKGFMLVTTSDTDVEITPGAIISDRYLVLPMASRDVAEREGCTWVLEDRNRLVTALQSNETEVFPLKYRLAVVVSGEALPRAGTVT